MDDQFDKDLQKRIREVFDNYEDTTADEGWLQLRKKFPEQQSDRRGFVWLWRGAAAALVLICLGVGMWLNNKPIKMDNKLVKQLKPASNVKGDKPEGENNGGPLAATKDSLKNTNPSKTFPIPEVNKRAANRVLGNTLTQVNPSLKNSKAVIPATALIKNNQQTTVLPISKTPAYPTGSGSVVAQTKADTANSAFNKAAADQFATTAKPATTKPVASVVIKPKPAEKSVDAMFREDNNKPLPKAEDDAQTKRVRFGVYAATYFNYAKGSQNQLNLGAGFSSDIKINKNLKLVTGVAIAQNSLNYNSSPSATADVAPSSVIPLAATASFKALSTPVVTNHTASLVGLDIPLNLKYEFNPQKSDAYFSAGFSSGTFINETYSYNYNYPSLLSPSLQKQQDETSSKSFSNFYFAKTLNVAFGIGAPLGKNRLVIEPFLKYPLDGLGAQNIRFGAGGVNLKFNFLTPKK